MKSKLYPSAILLLLSSLMNISYTNARSFWAPPGSTPASGTTNFNSLYSGSYVDLTGVQSAGGAGLLAPNVAGYDFRLLASSGVADCGIGIEPFTGQTALVYGSTQSGLTNLTALEISSNDSKFFDLQSVDITVDGLSAGITKNVRLVGYRSGSPVAGALLVQSVTAASFGGLLVNFNVSGNSNFIGIDKFRIETDGTYTISGAIGVDNINAINFRGVLPITLISYNAAIQDNKAVLNWRMVSELNSSSMVIEKSSDGMNFITIGSLSANVDHIGVAEYKFIDEHPWFGSNFYRIKLVDAAEAERYLGVRKVTYAYSSDVSLYPNPVVGSTVTLEIGNVKDIKELYSITDLAGNIISSGTITSYLQQIDVSRFIKGIYLLHLASGTTIKLQKL